MTGCQKYKILIDREVCIGDGACSNDAPETFEIDDESKAIVLDPPGDEEEAILDAAQHCPVDCITLVERASGRKVYPED